MRLFIFSLCIVLLIGCRDKNADRIKEECPQTFQYPGHYLKVPLMMSPHQIKYKVGDTLTISTIFPDSIEDISTRETYQVANFPFQPICLLYRFYDDLKWDAGFRVNELLIDSSYNAVYNTSNNYADSFKAQTSYEDEQYHFQFKTVFNVPGRYIFLMSDVYQEHQGAGNSHLNEETDAIAFEGKCPYAGFNICNIVQGDDHLNQFTRELVHLDNSVYRGNLASIHDTNSTGPFRGGPIKMEWDGFYAFEVEE